MIEIKKDNIFAQKVDALVNPVNCVGVMGKGLALQFKKKYPEVFQQYQKACTAQEVQPGKMLVILTGNDCPSQIINFPTKRHWRDSSKIEDIQSGLAALVIVTKDLELGSIAVPALGCGNGGLDWRDVKPLIVEAFEDLVDCQVIILEP